MINGLCDGILHSNIQASLSNIQASVGCQGNDMTVVFVLVFFQNIYDLLTCFESVYFRHIQIHEDELKATVFTLAGLLIVLYK